MRECECVRERERSYVRDSVRVCVSERVSERNGKKIREDPKMWITRRLFIR